MAQSQSATYVAGSYVSGSGGAWRCNLGYLVTSTPTNVTIDVARIENGTQYPDYSSEFWYYEAPTINIKNPDGTFNGTITIGGVTVVSPTGSDYYGPGSTTRRYRTINKTHSAQTIPVVMTAVSSNCIGTATGYINGTSTASANITVPALASYAVTYNANGGSGAPAAQTKWYGETLTLSSTKPTRYQHRFDGWATSATGAVVYAPGDYYTNNAALSLYAHWTKSFDLPTVTNVTTERWSEPNGVAAANGSSAKVEFDWTIDAIQLEKSQTAPKSLKVTLTASDGSWTENISATGLSGHSSVIVGNGELRPDTAYSVKVEIEDVNSTASATALIGADPDYFRPVISSGTPSTSTAGRQYSNGGLAAGSKVLVSGMTESQKAAFESALRENDSLGEWFLARANFRVYQADMPAGSSVAHGDSKVTVKLTYAGGSADAFERELTYSQISAGPDAVAFSFGTFDLDTAPPFPLSESPYLAVITVSDGYNEASLTIDAHGYYYSPYIWYMLTYRCDEEGKDDDEGVNAKVVIQPRMVTSGTQTHLKAVKICVSERDSGTVVADRVYNYDPKTEAEEEMEFLLKAQDGDAYKTNPETGAKILFDTDLSYLVTVTVEDVYSSGTKADVVSLAFFTMDVLAGGHGVAFGKPAKREMLDVAMPAQFDSALRIAEQLDWPVFHFDSEIPMVDSSESDLPVVPCVAVVTKYYEGLANTRPAEVWACYSQIPETWLKLYPSSAVTGITRSGTTFTATRADGTTFTFDQDHSSNSLSDMRFTWSSSVTTTDWFLARDTAATGTPLFRTISPANARTAMNAVNKAGDTMTGMLTANGHVQAPSSGMSWIGGKTLTNCAFSQTTQTTQSSYHPFLGIKTVGGHVWNLGSLGNSIYMVGFYASRTVNGTDYSHRIDASTGGIYLDTSRVFSHKAVLYNNTTGTNGTVTLSASAANYNHMRVFYKDNDAYKKSQDVNAPNGSTFIMDMHTYSNNSYHWHKTARMVISGTSITKTKYGSHMSGSSSNDGSNNMYIYRIEAWNE